VQELIACKGTIFFTGVGKSGFISQKVAQIFVSTGTKAAFLSPTDALHGDIGIVAPGDMVLMFSKSGNTEEMLKLLPFIKVRACATAVAQV
jgi:arabinose-5-phosphate isomerase